MTKPMFRPTPNGIVAIVELSQSELDRLLFVLAPQSDLRTKIAEAATLVRKMEALT